MVLGNSVQIVFSLILVIFNILPVSDDSNLHLESICDPSEYLVNCTKQYLNVCDNILSTTVLSPFPIQNKDSKIKLVTKSINRNQYYLTLALLICGDVHPCPGPPRFPCTICSKGVRKNSKAVSCDICEQWIHIKCARISLSHYNHLAESNCDFSFVCQVCESNSLPFSNCDTLDFGDDYSPTQEQRNEPQNSNVDNLDFYECFKKKGLHFVHVNARSILPKISELRLIAANSKAAVIGVSETWLDDSVNDSEVSIDNYNIYRKDRSRNGGGVCVYVRSDFAFNTRSDLQNEGIEAVWIDLILPKTKPILICIAYRPPKQSNFFAKFEQTLLNYENLPESEFYLLGDINININNSKVSKCGLGISLQEWCNMFDISQIINSPTRITSDSESLIDHIYVSNTEKVAQSGVIDLGFSDHSMIFCTRKTVRSLYNSHNSVKIRSMKNYSVETLNAKLNSVDWLEFYSSTCVDTALTIFCNTFTDILDSIAPIKTIRIKQRTEPWMTDNILQNIRERNRTFYNFRKTKSHLLYKKYCQLRNKVQRLVKEAKQNYIDSEIEENKHKPKLLWKVLSKLGYSDKSKQKSKIGLDINGERCFDEAKVADEFNNFYTSVAADLVSKLPNPLNYFTSHHVNHYYANKGVLPNMFSLQPITSDCVLKQLKSLNKTKSTGLDGISAKFLNDSADHIHNQVTHILNLSITSSKVPRALKKAKVVPLYKKDNKFDVGNYRPVSILCSLSKILERVVYDQLEQFLIGNNLLYEFQSGFRSKFSTDTCLIHLTDFIKEEISHGNYVGMILIDLRKAFDTVDHAILCSKLKAMGLNDQSVQWFNSYLCHRTQLVEINGTKSDFNNISCGVPQGSILGPILFNIYVNDMVSSVQCKLLLYADDSCLIVSNKDKNIIESTLTNEIENLSKWLVDNKLSLHLGKTESILFGSKSKLKKCSKLNISCNGFPIASKTQVKYLGALLDQSVSGNPMATGVLKKANHRLKFLYRQGKYLDKDSKKTLCQSLVLTHFDYSCSSWHSGLLAQNKKRLQTCQNKLARYCLNLTARSHIGPEELDSLGWLDVHHRVCQMKLTHVHKIFNNSAPKYLEHNFHRLNTIHSYNTRGSSFNFYEQSVNSISEKTFYHTGIKLWNHLPKSIQTIEPLHTFKSKLKLHLKEEMYRKEAEVFYYY